MSWGFILLFLLLLALLFSLTFRVLNSIFKAIILTTLLVPIIALVGTLFVLADMQEVQQGTLLFVFDNVSFSMEGREFSHLSPNLQDATLVDGTPSQEYTRTFFFHSNVNASSLSSIPLMIRQGLVRVEPESHLYKTMKRVPSVLLHPFLRRLEP